MRRERVKQGPDGEFDAFALARLDPLHISLQIRPVQGSAVAPTRSKTGSRRA
jgi:hypothetical protein